MTKWDFLGALGWESWERVGSKKRYRLSCSAEPWRGPEHRAGREGGLFPKAGLAYFCGPSPHNSQLGVSQQPCPTCTLAPLRTPSWLGFKHTRVSVSQAVSFWASQHHCTHRSYPSYPVSPVIPASPWLMQTHGTTWTRPLAPCASANGTTWQRHQKPPATSNIFELLPSPKRRATKTILEDKFKLLKSSLVAFNSFCPSGMWAATQRYLLTLAGAAPQTELEQWDCSMVVTAVLQVPQHMPLSPQSQPSSCGLLMKEEADWD